MSGCIRTISISGGCNQTLNSAALKYPLLAYGSGTEILLHNLENGITCQSLSGHSSRVNCLAISGNILISGGGDKKLIIWENFAKKQEILVKGAVINISIGKNHVIALSADGEILSFKREENLILDQEINLGMNLQESLAIADYFDKEILALGGADSRIHIYTYQNEWVFQNSLEGHVRTVRSLDWKIENEDIFLVSGSQDSYIRIWKFFKEIPHSLLESQGLYLIESLQMSAKLEAVAFGHTGPVSSVKWMGNSILSSSHDFTVQIWNEDQYSGSWITTTTLGQIGGNKNLFFGALSDENSQHILAHGYSGGFYHWILSSGEWKNIPAPTGHFNSITDIALASDFVITSSSDQTARIWAEWNGIWKELSRPMIHGYDLNCICCYGNYIISGGDEKIIRILETSSVTADILSRDAGISLSGTKRGAGQALGLATKSSEQESFNIAQIPVTEDILNSYTLWPEIAKLYGHGYEVAVLCPAHLSPLLASASKSQNAEHANIILWNLESRTQVGSLSFHTLGVTDLAFSHNDQFLLSVSRDRSWCLYAFEENVYKIKASLQAHTRIIYCCAWNPADTNFITGSRDKKLKIWNTNGELLDTLNLPQPITACVYINDDIIAAGLEDGKVLIMNLKTKTEIGAFSHGAYVTKLRWNGRHLFSASEDNTLRVHIVDLN